MRCAVRSVNDEAPEWEGGGAACGAACGARRGTALCAARARDPDGAALTYALTDVTWDAAPPSVPPYALDPDTGTIYLRYRASPTFRYLATSSTTLRVRLSLDRTVLAYNIVCYVSADLVGAGVGASLRVCARDGALATCRRMRVSAQGVCAPSPHFPHALQDARLYENVTAPATITTVSTPCAYYYYFHKTANPFLLQAKHFNQQRSRR